VTTCFPGNVLGFYEGNCRSNSAITCTDIIINYIIDHNHRTIVGVSRDKITAVSSRRHRHRESTNPSFSKE